MSKTTVDRPVSQPTVGSLFAGIGGFDLGFERAGFEVVWQVEIDEWARKVLAKNFPKAERYADIRECGIHNLKRVDVIVGGFPCQDISNAGLRAGIGGARSGLWGEMLRIVRELQPRFVLVENVAALLGRGMGRVLGDLAAIGYDAEWEIVSATDVGAPHLRERVWILAYPQSERRTGGGMQRDAIDVETCGERKGETIRVCSGEYALADSSRVGWNAWRCDDGGDERPVTAAGGEFPGEIPDTLRCGCGALRARGLVRVCEQLGPAETPAHSKCAGVQEPVAAGRSSEAGEGIVARPCLAERDWWAVEPNVGRVAHGVPHRVDRLRGLGNAVVRQIPEMYARRIRALLEA